MDFIKKLIEKRQAELADLEVKNKNAKNVEELRAISDRIAEVKDEIKNAKSELEEMRSAEHEDANPFKDVAHKNENRNDQSSRSMEYRMSFMNYVLGKGPKPEVPQEFRAAAATGTGDVGAYIPGAIVDEIVKPSTGAYGQLYNRVKKTNKRFGRKIGVDDLGVKSGWIAEKACVVPQGVQSKTTITFELKTWAGAVSVSFQADTLTLDEFERDLIEAVREAFYKDADLAIIAGDGNLQPLGITKDPRVKNKAQLTVAEFKDFEAWNKNVWGKLPLGKTDGTLIVGKSTAYGVLYNMKDGNGNPMFNIVTDSKYPAGVEFRFMGHEGIMVEDTVLKNIETASNSDVVAVFAKLNDYAFNFNKAFTFRTFEDPRCLETVHMAYAFADGKAADVSGMLLIQKKDA